MLNPMSMMIVVSNNAIMRWIESWRVHSPLLPAPTLFSPSAPRSVEFASADVDVTRGAVVEIVGEPVGDGVGADVGAEVVGVDVGLSVVTVVAVIVVFVTVVVVDETVVVVVSASTMIRDHVAIGTRLGYAGTTNFCSDAVTVAANASSKSEASMLAPSPANGMPRVNSYFIVAAVVAETLDMWNRVAAHPQPSLASNANLISSANASSAPNELATFDSVLLKRMYPVNISSCAGVRSLHTYPSP